MAVQTGMDGNGIVTTIFYSPTFRVRVDSGVKYALACHYQSS